MIAATLRLAVLFLLSGPGIATAAPASFGNPHFGTPEEVAAEIEEARENATALPGTGLVAVRAPDGGLTLVTTNGRFAVQGRLVDLWHNRELTTLEQVDQAARIDFSAMGVDFRDLFTLTYGQGSQEVVIFADPLCPHCHSLLRSAAALFNEYTFRVVVIGVLGSQSTDAVAAIGCTPDREAAKQAMASGHYTGLSYDLSSCDHQPLMRSLLVSRAIGVEGTPAVIAPNGEMYQGVPRNLRRWLGDNS